MKIITHMQLFSHLFLRKNAYGFSNFIKDSPLSFDDLIINRPQKSSSPSSNKMFNISPSKSFVKDISTHNVSNAEDRRMQQSTLKLIDEALLRPTFKRTVTTFRNKEIDAETQIENAISFMKYLDHSLQKTAALKLVQMIESYCCRTNQHKEISQMLPTFERKNNQTEKEKGSEQLFNSIREHLVCNLNFYSENLEINNQFIASLFQILAEADPTIITVENFERECFSLDEEERMMQLTGKQYFEASCGGKYYDQVKANPPTEQIKQKGKFNMALEEAFQLKDRTKFSKLHLKKVVGVDQNKGKEQKLKLASDKVIFSKKNVKNTIVNKQTKEEDLKSAYLYELPFSITQNQANEFIRYLQSSKSITIESFVLFPYKNFIEKNHHQVIFRVPDRYQEKNNPIEKMVKSVEVDELTKKNKQGTKNRYLKKYKSKFDDVPLQNQPSHIKSVTEALLLKIKKESYCKFNKSSMLIKFSSQQDKEAVLNLESRLYGLNYKGFRNVKFEEGFCKTMVSLAGIPWGCSSKQLERHLNKILQVQKIPIKVQQNCILTKNTISIQFDYLSQAILAIQKLNNITFQNKQLKAYLSYGPCKVFNNEYNINVEVSYEKLKKKIQNSSVYYEKKYQLEEAKSSQ